MLQTEIITINEVEFVHNYSDADYCIARDGVTYAEAYDPAEFASERTYTETDIPADNDELTDEDYAQAGRILLGVADDE